MTFEDGKEYTAPWQGSMRRVGGVMQKSVSVDVGVSESTPLGNVIDALREAADGLIEPRVYEVRHWTDRDGDPYAAGEGGGDIEVTGWKLATDEDVEKFVAAYETNEAKLAKVREEREARIAADKARADAAALERAKAAFPGLFRDEDEVARSAAAQREMRESGELPA